MATTTRLLTKADLRRAASRFGGTLDEQVYGGSLDAIIVDAPAGKLWACDAIHILSVPWWTRQAAGDEAATWNDDAVRDAISRLESGVMPCEDAECEYCHPID